MEIMKEDIPIELFESDEVSFQNTEGIGPKDNQS